MTKIKVITLLRHFNFSFIFVIEKLMRICALQICVTTFFLKKKHLQIFLTHLEHRFFFVTSSALFKLFCVILHYNIVQSPFLYHHCCVYNLNIRINISIFFSITRNIILDNFFHKVLQQLPSWKCFKLYPASY